MATTATSKVRKLTVCNKGFQRRRLRNTMFLPVIVLTGKWLEAAGFEAGQVVDVACSDARLVITLSEEQRFEEFKPRYRSGKRQ